MTIEAHPQTIRTLDRLARQRGQLREELFCQAVVQFTPDAARPMPKGMGAYDSGHGDISTFAE